MIGRSLVSLVAILAVALTGVVWGYLRNTDQGFLQVAALDPDSTDVVDAEGQYGDETYLIVGTDTRTGASGEVGAGTVADAEGARSTRSCSSTSRPTAAASSPSRFPVISM